MWSYEHRFNRLHYKIMSGITRPDRMYPNPGHGNHVPRDTCAQLLWGSVQWPSVEMACVVSLTAHSLFLEP